MGSKQFKNELCIYCGIENSTTNGDHLFARALVEEKFRDGIKKVPCCNSCNNNKSLLEHYLASVLPFGNNQQNNVEMLRLAGDKLKKNRKLHNSLSVGFQTVHIPGGIDSEKTITVPFDSTKLLEYAHYLTLGLLFLEFEYKGKFFYPNVQFLGTEKMSNLITNSIYLLDGRKVEGKIANNAAIYESITSVGEPLISFWKYNFYAGATLVNTKSDPTKDFWVVLAPQNSIEELRSSLGKDCCR